MRYLKQFGIILAVSFVGEGLHYIIPLPIPASIYGLILMFICLKTGIFSYESVKETGTFLIDILPLMFIPPAVGLVNAWHIVQPILLPYIIITVVSTVLVMIVSGRTAQAAIRHGGKKADK